MTDKKDGPESNVQAPGAAAFMAVHSPDSVIRGNVSYGSPVGASLYNSPGSLIEGNTHYDKAALTLFENIESTLKKSASALPQEQSERLLSELKEMRASYSSPSFKEKYVSFMSSLSDHATVLTALAPFIKPLAMLMVAH